MTRGVGPDGTARTVTAGTGTVLDPALLAEFRQVLGAAVVDATRIRRRDLDAFVDVGRRAATRGVAFRTVVDGYLSTAAAAWPDLPEVAGGSADQVRRSGQAVLRAIADISSALAAGYERARRELVREQLTERREFVDELLLGGAYGLAGLVDRAARFGLDLAGPHAVAVVRAERPIVDGSAAARRLEAALLTGATADALVTTRDGVLVAVFGAAGPSAVRHAVDLLTAVLPDPSGAVRLARTAEVGRWRLGVGRPHAGPSGVRLSHQEAQESLDLGERLRGYAGLGPVYDSAELDVPRVLIRDESAMWDLVHSVLEPLRAARGGAGPLVATLDAYFAAGGNSSAAARALHLSPRALTYRLTRIAELTGHDPADPGSAYALQTALLGARFLGWPDHIAETRQT